MSKNIIFYFLFFILVVFVLYFKSLTRYFTLDDTSYILLARNIKTLKDFFSIFTYALQPQTFRPISIQAYFLFMTRIFGVNPVFYHLTNVILFSIDSLLIFLIVRKIGNTNIAFFTTLIYITRTLHTIAVFYVAAGEELFMSVFLFSSFLSYLIYRERKEKKYIIISVVFFVLSLLSKETAVFLPLIIFFYEILFSTKNINFKKIYNFKVLNQVSIYFFVAFFYLVYRFFIIKPLVDTGEYRLGFGLNIFRNLLEYLRITLDAYEPKTNIFLKFFFITISSFSIFLFFSPVETL